MQIDSLIAKFAKEHSKSETTRLQSQLATKEVSFCSRAERFKGLVNCISKGIVFIAMILQCYVDSIEFKD